MVSNLEKNGSGTKDQGEKSDGVLTEWLHHFALSGTKRYGVPSQEI